MILDSYHATQEEQRVEEIELKQEEEEELAAAAAAAAAAEKEHEVDATVERKIKAEAIARSLLETRLRHEKFDKMDSSMKLKVRAEAFARSLLQARLQYEKQSASPAEPPSITEYDDFSTEVTAELEDQDLDDDEEDDDDEDVDGDLDAETAKLTAPFSDSAYEDKVKTRHEKKAYDRTAMLVLGNNIVHDGVASSPYRKGSFDLLGLLATQESIHRVLREYKEAGEERDVSFEWLRTYYISRVSDYFDGNQSYGRADDFLEELMLTPPAMKEMDGKMGFIDPMRIAEDIIATRSEVAKDWKDIIADVPLVDHAELRKVVLQIRMGNLFENSVPLGQEKTKKTGAKVEEEGFQ